MTDWFRSWHGAPTDPKWLGIARRSGVAPGIAVAVAWALMDRASQASERGSVAGYDAEGLAYFFGCEPDQIDAIVRAMTDKGMISDGRFASWEKRQPKREDDSSKRVKEHRKRKQQQSERTVTHCNAPDTDTDTDTDLESSDANASSSPEPAKAAPVVSSPVAIELPCVSGDPCPVTEADVAEWNGSFPAVDVRQQLAAMRAWLNANPTKRKTRRGMRRFIVAWLDRQQNRAGTQSTGPPRGQSPPSRDANAFDAYDQIAKERGWTDEPEQLPSHHGDAQRLSAEPGGHSGPVVDLRHGHDWH